MPGAAELPPAHGLCMYVFARDYDRCVYAAAAVGISVARTISSIRSAASFGDSCSQTRTTFHPAASSAAAEATSRCLLALILSAHHFTLDLVLRWWSGQPCQKQPCT